MKMMFDIKHHDHDDEKDESSAKSKVRVKAV